MIKNHLQGHDSLSNDSFTKIVKLIKRQKILNPVDFIKKFKKKIQLTVCALPLMMVLDLN